jgi:ubiquinone/menaquinone biosynthesis C-methylase UbiE
MNLHDSSPSHIRKVYDLASIAYESIFFDDLSDARWLDRFTKAMPAASTILDVGCGPGNFTVYLGSRGLRPVGVDISFEMLAVGRSHRGVHYPLIQGSMEHLPFSTGVFDGVLVAYSLLHIPKDRVPSVLRELRRVCRAGGRGLLLLKEGEGEGMIPASLVPGEVLFVSLWTTAEIAPLLSSAGWHIAGTDTNIPARAEEIQYPKLALTLIAH